MKSIKTHINALTSAASKRFKIERLLGLSLAIVLLLGGITTVRAQILYTQFGANGTRQLRQINADGSGDTVFGLPFSTLVFPAWTRDASRFAISAPNPNFPNQRSYNVFAINTATGATQQITRFTDLFDSQTGVTSYSFPLYKSFSPNQTAMAVSTDIGYSSGGTTTTPVLEVYSTTVVANPLQVHVHAGRNGKHHAGEGVDWSPTQNLLVTGVKGSATFQSGGNTGEVTALLLMEPINAAVLTGHYRQLTFPRADGGVTTSGGFLWGEHDYQPKFSPNGVGVAYVRSFQNFNINVGSPDPDIQSLRIVNVNTGADTEVLRLNAGLYVSSLDWSPDGTALVFEVGQQEVGPLGYQQSVNPATDEIYIVNVNGTNLRRLRTAGNGNPAWKPNGAVAPTITHRAGDYDGDGKADLGVFRPSSGSWYLQQSQNGFTGVAFGASTDRIVPADYDGDGKTTSPFIAMERGIYSAVKRVLPASRSVRLMIFRCRAITMATAKRTSPSFVHQTERGICNAVSKDLPEFNSGKWVISRWRRIMTATAKRMSRSTETASGISIVRSSDSPASRSGRRKTR